jgi:hypothetical protein
MKKMNVLKTVFTLCLSGVVLTSSSCKKSSEAPDGPGEVLPSAQNPHQMNDPRIVGEWKNVSVSDFNWETDYGVNAGPQNGSYIDYKINTDGSGTCIKYVTTTEQGSTYSIFQRSSGFFKANKNSGTEGYYEFTYCPTSGIVEITRKMIRIVPGISFLPTILYNLHPAAIRIHTIICTTPTPIKMATWLPLPTAVLK